MSDGTSRQGIAALHRSLIAGAAAPGADGAARSAAPSNAAPASGIPLALARRRAIQVDRGRYDLALDTLAVPADRHRRLRPADAASRVDAHLVLPERMRPLRLNRDATIYHEISHLWFGDFVTMRGFDDLRLKEGFAT